MNFTPPYPKPHKDKSTFFLRFIRGWNSWLDVLFERSYRMKMGQVYTPRSMFYIVNDPEWVRKILVEKAKDYPKHKMLHILLEPLLGNSIFTTNGAVWERQRRLVDMAFEQARLKLVFPLMTACAKDMTDRLDTIANGESYEVDPEMTYVTADIIFRTILSENLEGPEALEIFEAFIEFQRHAQRAMVLAMYMLPVSWVTRSGCRSAEKIRSILSVIIERRYKEYHAGVTDKYDDILAGLMEAKDPVTHDSFTYQELLDQVCMLFLAGHETSASTLSWSMYLISNAPDLQQKMYEEIMESVGDRDFEMSDIKKMPKVWDVFRESMRLYPPVGTFVREATHDHCIRDKEVEKGSPVMVSPWLLHRHRELWERPDEFDPERFHTPSGQESLKCAFIPFSKGPRVCIGAAFATQEAILIIASVVRRFKLIADENHVPEPIGRVTIRSNNGIRVRMERRDQKIP